MNRPSVVQCIYIECSAGAAYVIKIRVPLRFPGLDWLALHPGSEALVEPDVVPPFHGDEIAEPLMSHLMCDDAGDRLFQIDGALLLINQQNHFAEGDAAGILHGSGREIRDPD